MYLFSSRMAHPTHQARRGAVMVVATLGLWAQIGTAQQPDALPDAALDASQHHHASAARPRSRRRKLISLDLQRAKIEHVIRLMADVSGVNIVFGDDVTGTVTLKLRQVPWEDALRIALKTQQLGMVWESERLIRVAPQTTLDEEKRRALNAAMACEQHAPLQTRLIPVNEGHATKMASIIKTMISNRGSVSVDERTNTVIVRDVACGTAWP